MFSIGKNVYIIAGEASGDLHASNLVKEMKVLDSGINYRAWGGDLLSAQGVDVVKHYRELAFMGFVEVAKNLKTILGNLKKCKQDILDFKPDFVILVDYPGFNLRIAEFLKKEGIPVVYYISPQVWAWKKSRVHKIKRDVDLMLTILPFESEFYDNYEFDVSYVGHPLLDAIEVNTDSKGYVALLPGSRKQEIEGILPVMNEVAKMNPDLNFVLGMAPGRSLDDYDKIVNASNIELSDKGTSSLLNGAQAALVTSGTATLETALYEIPQVVCYKGSYITYLIAKNIVDVKYISLVNLIMDSELVKELIQGELTPENLNKELLKILPKGKRYASQKQRYQDLKNKLGGPGASKRAAERILELF